MGLHSTIGHSTVYGKLIVHVAPSMVVLHTLFFVLVLRILVSKANKILLTIFEVPNLLKESLLLQVFQSIPSASCKQVDATNVLGHAQAMVSLLQQVLTIASASV
jgi:hypothetical protein